MEDKEEIWLPIPGFAAYDVSNFGNVRSYYKRKRIGDKDSIAWEIAELPQRMLKQWTDPQGYKIVNLIGENKNQHQYQIARLVLLAFIGPRPDGYQSCHNDGDPANNRLSNLRYDTPQGNSADIPTEKRGIRSGYPLPDDDIVSMRIERANGARTIDLAKKYGISHGSVSHICTGKTFQHLPGPRTSKQHTKKLNETSILAIRRRRANHEPPRKLANEYGVSRELILDICSGKRYAEYGGQLTTGHVAIKWTRDVVLKIRGARARGASLKELANTFHTCPTNISRICTGKRHPEYGGPITRPWETIIR